MKKILVCEDEDSIRSFVVINLRRAGYQVTETASGEEALARYEADPAISVALLDGMLPGIDGFETCRRLRQMNSRMGIIMLTALTGETEKVGGLKAGADDYVTKPFSIAELLARIESLYRRLQVPSEGDASARLHSGDFVLDLRSHLLQFEDKSVELTQIESQIMAFFLNNPGRIITRAEIMEAVWQNEEFVDDKIVDVNVRRLRMKVEAEPSAPRHLQTVWGRGYQWNG